MTSELNTPFLDKHQYTQMRTCKESSYKIEDNFANTAVLASSRENFPVLHLKNDGSSIRQRKEKPESRPRGVGRESSQ
jgi:hypothetical protein